MVLEVSVLLSINSLFVPQLDLTVCCCVVLRTPVKPSNTLVLLVFQIVPSCLTCAPRDASSRRLVDAVPPRASKSKSNRSIIACMLLVCCMHEAKYIYVRSVTLCLYVNFVLFVY